MPLSITPDQHPARSNDTSCIVLSQPSGAIVGSMTIGIAHTVPSLCITLEMITPWFLAAEIVSASILGWFR